MGEKMKKIALGMALLASAGIAHAQGFNEANMYFGGGLSSNDLDGFGDNSTGFQIFAGYGLDMVDLGAIKSAVEVGYMDSGDWEEDVCVTFFGTTSCAKASASAQGLWANYVASYDFSPSLSGIGRIGLDLGDDDGLMYGVGVGFKLAPQIDIRGEYVIRDHINSLQANLVYRMK
jgi:hypothetical protein